MNSEGTEPGNSRTGTAAQQEAPTAGANGGGVVLGGRYRLGERLGQGGMSTVFQAHDNALGREVAVKLFRSDIADETELARQRGEVRVLAGLNHPNLVMVYDAVTDTDSLEARTYLVMELVQGTDLHRVRQRSELGDDDGMGPADIADMGAGLADALAYIHERGIVHRDVKPANILLGDGTGAQQKGHAKLTDFGIARLVDSARLTATGQSMGTATYFSPEQAQGLAISPTSDIYSLGLVLLESLTGKVEFPGPAIASAAARVQRDPEIPSWLGEGWAEVLTAMTRRDPMARPSAVEIAAALRTGPEAGALGEAYSLDPDTESLPSTDQTESYPGGGAGAGAGAAGAGAAAGAAGSAYGPPTSQMPAVRPRDSGSDAEGAGESGGADGGVAPRSGSQLWLPDDDDDQGPAEVGREGRSRVRRRERRAEVAAARTEARSANSEAAANPEARSTATTTGTGSAGPAHRPRGSMGGSDEPGAATPAASAVAGKGTGAGSPTGSGARTDSTGAAAGRNARDADRKGRGPSAGQWMIVVLSLAAVVIVAGIFVFLSLDPSSAPAPVDYPPVPGELGRNLEDLQESVTP